jgi:hypothetical protein
MNLLINLLTKELNETQPKRAIIVTILQCFCCIHDNIVLYNNNERSSIFYNYLKLIIVLLTGQDEVLQRLSIPIYKQIIALITNKNEYIDDNMLCLTFEVKLLKY